MKKKLKSFARLRKWENIVWFGEKDKKIDCFYCKTKTSSVNR